MESVAANRRLPDEVVANYAYCSILLPTVSNQPRLTAAEKEDYFHHFLENKPVGKIDSRIIEIGCNSAVDAGLYTFTFGATGAQVKARPHLHLQVGRKAMVDLQGSTTLPQCLETRWNGA